MTSFDAPRPEPNPSRVVVILNRLNARTAAEREEEQQRIEFRGAINKVQADVRSQHVEDVIRPREVIWNRTRAILLEHSPAHTNARIDRSERTISAGASWRFTGETTLPARPTPVQIDITMPPVLLHTDANGLPANDLGLAVVYLQDGEIWDEPGPSRRDREAVLGVPIQKVGWRRERTLPRGPLIAAVGRELPQRAQKLDVELRAGEDAGEKQPQVRLSIARPIITSGLDPLLQPESAMDLADLAKKRGQKSPATVEEISVYLRETYATRKKGGLGADFIDLAGVNEVLENILGK